MDVINTSINAYESARYCWNSEQDYQSYRYKGESYDFERKDDEAYYLAQKWHGFWKSVASYCPHAPKRIERPVVPIGGGGS